MRLRPPNADPLFAGRAYGDGWRENWRQWIHWKFHNRGSLVFYDDDFDGSK